MTDADKGLGEQGRATVELDIPAGVSGEQTLNITTDAGTNVSLPVTVDGEGETGSPTGKATDARLGIILGVIAAVLALILPLVFAFEIDTVLGPIARINPR